MVNKRKFEQLSDENKAALREAAAEAVAWQRAKAAQEDIAAKDALIEAGMTFTPISEDVRAELRSRSSVVIDELKGRIGSEIIDAVLIEAAH